MINSDAVPVEKSIGAAPPVIRQVLRNHSVGSTERNVLQVERAVVLATGTSAALPPIIELVRARPTMPESGVVQAELRRPLLAGGLV
jgi:hypothetical protein